MTDSTSQVRIQGNLTNPFPTQCGLKQGDGLAPLLFNLALEHTIRQIPIDTKGTLFFKSTQLVAFADDINILSRSAQRAKETLLNLDDAAKEVGLQINESKTKIMTQTRKQMTNNQTLTIGGYNLERVDKFTYLGSELTQDGQESNEIKRRIQLANKTYFSVLPIIKSRCIHRKTKLLIYKSMVRPVLCYGCETWTLTQASEKLLNAFERKVLRRILGAVRE